MQRGFFCVSTSYRQEPNAIPVDTTLYSQCLNLKCRGYDDLKKMEYELCEYLEFPKPEERTYADWQKHFGLDPMTEMEAEHETKMFEEFGSTMITDFPEMTSPFWNMSRHGDATSKKIDVILDDGNNDVLPNVHVM